MQRAHQPSIFKTNTANKQLCLLHYFLCIFRLGDENEKPCTLKT